METLTFARALAAAQAAGGCLLATVLEGPCCGRQLLAQGGRPVWPARPAPLLAQHLPALQALDSPGGLLTLEGARVFVQRFGPPPRLVICGGGHVAQALAGLASVVGLPVCALEDRPDYAEAMRRAGAGQVLCGPFAGGLAQLPGTAGDYYVVLTRGHCYDLDCLGPILQRPAAYVGMMASRRRAALVRSQLLAAGADPARVAALHAPVGLAIGAQTAQEIALSILAEIVQCKNSTPQAEGFAPELLAQMDTRQDWVLATIVARRGSTPRAAGARMLAGPEGLLAGSVGGGILEHRALQLARQLPGPQLVELVSDGSGADAALAACGGAVTLFLQRAADMEEQA